MYRLYLLAIFIILPSYLVHAQTNSAVRGTVQDANNGEALPGSVLEFTPLDREANPSQFGTEARGRINIRAVPYGTYRIKVSFLGYDDHIDTLTIESPSTDLGIIAMNLSPKRIDTVFFEGQAMRTTQHGDTVVYNADAFKVARDADAEGLLSKMPGITVIDGEVEAQGETVKKVFVDGREFFGDDVTTAIKNLPAEVIERVEVYNKLSDQAEFTGIDDGEGFKALNFVTSINKGHFGKFSAGYGIEDKYVAGGNYNFFKDDMRVSVLGLINNINQVNFAMEDILGAVNASGGMQSRGGGRMRMGGAGGFMMRPQDGISKVGSLGLNYNDKWGQKWTAAMSYFFNTTRNDNERTTDRNYYSEGDSYRNYNAVSESWSRNYENRFNARLDYKPNDVHTLMFRPRISFQNYKSAQTIGSTTEEIYETFRELLNTAHNVTESRRHGINIANSIIYRVKLGKAGRTLTLDAGGNYGSNYRKGMDATEEVTPADPFYLFKQRTVTDSKNWRVNGSVVYTEPIAENTQITAQYRANYSYSDSDRRTYLWDDALQVFDDDFSTDLSNIYNSEYFTQRVGPGINFSNKRDVFNASVYYQRSTLTSNRDYPTLSRIDRSYDNLVYHMMYNKSFNSTNTLRIHARSNTSNPSVNQLQDAPDLSNTQFVTRGNPGLKPSYSHNIFVNYNRSSVDKGRTFMAAAGFNAQTRYIADSTVVSPTGTEITTPVNMNGRWSVNAMLSFGLPLNFMLSNVNFNMGAMYTESPSYIDRIKNKQRGQYYSAGVVLGSNISDRLDFTASYNGGYNIVDNTINERADNSFFSQGASFSFKWEIWKGITFSGNVNYSQYFGITDDYNEQYIIANLYVGKKLFKNRRGEIQFGVNDLFDQNKNFRRNVTERYIENVVNSALGRYFGFQFTYSLRNFGGRSGEGDRLHEFPGPPGGPGPGRPPGPPPGGFPPR